MTGTAATACATCGREAREDARFCDACGSPISAATEAAEYKQVTVLFADVVHSMDVASAVGPERLREIMAELVDRASAAVQHYGGTVDKFTGDGIMALFGAPAALEDHAFRACLAALAIQEEATTLSDEVGRRDRISLQLRVGLNSGQVIAGEVGSGRSGYTAIGAHVGMAQRMESAAPPGGVMLSASTARLVEHAAELGEPEMVHIKGADAPVRAYRLMGTKPRAGPRTRRQPTLVGRQPVLESIADDLAQAIAGHGCLVSVIGPPGIGKSRVAHESAAMARSLGMDVISVSCESHATGIAFRAVADLLRAATGVSDLDSPAARQHIRGRNPDADDEDLLLLDDLLGIADVGTTLPDIDPDARRRRLTKLINTVSLARDVPALYIIEDVHWIDEVSDSMLADFLEVLPRSRSTVMITYRPEYCGALTRLAGKVFRLLPLDVSHASALTAELVGTHPSVTEIAAKITERAAGNPFFTEEIVRDLVDQGVLSGQPGDYRSIADITNVGVPATLQATVAARIDRLSPAAKRTLSGAAVIGTRFTADLLVSLAIDPSFDELLRTELVDSATDGRDEYVFRHPLIRTVAYEAQLRSDRAEMHRRLAVAIEKTAGPAVEASAAMIAQHLEAAGDLRDAFGWHMRAGGWSATRDITAAQISWQGARRVADQMPDDDPARPAMRIAPRTLLCATSWRGGGTVADTGFDELRELTSTSGDKRSLAMGMVGLVMALTLHSHHRESSRLATECMALFESIGDDSLTVGLAFPLVLAKYEAGEVAEALRMADRAIDLAGGDPVMGNLIFGSPLALLTAIRGILRGLHGQQGAKEDTDRAIILAREHDPASLVFVIMYKYLAITAGALFPDDQALRETAEGLRIAEKSGDDFALAAARFVRGITLYYRGGHERQTGFDLLMQTRDAALRERFSMTTLSIIDSLVAKEKARSGDLDGAIELARSVVEHLSATGEKHSRAAVTTALVELLLSRGNSDDLREAEDVLDALTAVPADPGSVINELPALGLRALLARRRGDDAAYRDFADRYLAMARSLDAVWHIAMAEAM